MPIKRRTLLAGAIGSGAVTLGAGRAWSQAAAPIRIGVTMPMSGGAALYGNAYFKGAKLMADYINASGKLGSRIELVLRDHKGDPNATLVNIRELKAAGINLVIGGIPTGPALAEEGVARDLGMVHIVAGAQGESITHQNFSPNTFRSCLNGFMQVSGLTSVLAQKAPEVTRWVAIVYDNEFGQSSWNTFRSRTKANYAKFAKKEIVLEAPIMCKPGQAEWRTILGQVMSSPATGLFSTLVAPDAVSFFVQARSYNIGSKFAAICDTGGDFSLVSALGQAPGTFWSPSPWYPVAYRDNPISKYVEENWISSEKSPVLGFMVGGCNAVAAFAAAIDAARSTETAPVIAALETVTFDTPTGKASFRKEDHQLMPDVGYLKFGTQPGGAGWTLNDYVKLNTRDLAEPASPGAPIKYEL